MKKSAFARFTRMLPVGLLLATATAALVSGCATTGTESGFTSLFDGQTLNGWKLVDGKAGGYGVTNGVIYCARGGGGNLLTEKEYANFVLRFEFKLEEGSNNGLGIRAPLDGDAAYNGMELQILDEGAAAAGKWGKLRDEQYHGSIYDVIAAKRGALKPVGEWNTEEVIADGRQIKVIVNGQTIVDADLNSVTDPAKLMKHPGLLRTSGHIGFLGHNDYVEFRNIRVKELPCAAKAGAAPAGFTSLFNGKNLDGWKGLVADPLKRAKMSPTDLATAQQKADELMRANWKVEDGALVYRGNDFDNLCTTKDYANFELFVKWKVSPHADSGLYLRGTPQVQIWDPFTQPTAAGSEIGSGGLYNNKTNNKPSKVADRPVGEWNEFQIVMAGEKMHVFLNGELVVRDTALDNYWQKGAPLFPSGQIELQAHKTVVWFKDFYIREIPAK